MCLHDLANACSLVQQQLSGLNRICIFSCSSGSRATTVTSAELCPLSIPEGATPALPAILSAPPRFSDHGTSPALGGFSGSFQKSYDAQLNAAAAAAFLKQQANANDPVYQLSQKILPIEPYLSDQIYSTPKMKLKGWEPTNSAGLRKNRLPPGVVVAFILDCKSGESGCLPPGDDSPQSRLRQESYCRGPLKYLRGQGLVLVDIFMDKDFRASSGGLIYSESDCR
jgi:hypothetical protein